MATEARRELWGLWAGFAVLLALTMELPRLLPGREIPWHAGQAAVAGFVLALLAMVAGVSSFALREQVRAVLVSGLDPGASRSRVLLMLLDLWTRCIAVGALGSVLAWGAAAPRAAWPFVLAGAALLVFHAPRHPLLPASLR
jgi:hypothetical protein